MGSYIRNGDKLQSTYAPTGDNMVNLIEDFYNGLYGFTKSAGAATYGDNGYFNAIMGKKITAGMFTSDNAFSAIGARPYNHEGVRIATEQATYGLDDDGNFVGLGAGTIQDGRVPGSVAMPIQEFREPYKDLPMAYDYGLGLQALENKDDVSAYTAYMDMVSANYSDLADKTVLRPVYRTQPYVGEVETSLNSIERIVASYVEIGTEEGPDKDNLFTVDADMISPYGGSAGDFAAFRNVTEDNNINSHVLDNEWAELDAATLTKMYTMVAPNWANSAAPNNKIWLVSNICQRQLAVLAQNKNIYLDAVWAQKDFNGVKTWPGRDYGILLQSYLNVPLIIDGNLNFDFTTKKVSYSMVGNQFLLDLDHLWMSVLTPVEIYNATNPALTRDLREHNVMTSRMETRVDSFIQHGKIINVAESVS